jgi:hypothetical protein
MAWGSIDLRSALVAGVQLHGRESGWAPLWDLPLGARHGDLVRVVVLDGLAVVEGTGGAALDELRREYRRANGEG